MIDYAFVSAGFPVVDLPRCEACGGDFVTFRLDVGVDGLEACLVGHTVCGDCDAEPPFDGYGGKDSADWREAFLRCVNAWSKANGGLEYPAIAVLPDRVDEFVALAEQRFGPLPEYRQKVLAKHRLRRLV